MNKPLLAAIAAAIFIGRIITMTKNAMNVAKIAGVGMILGATVGVVGGCLTTGKKRTMKRRVRHATDMMGDLLGNVTYMFK